MPSNIAIILGSIAALAATIVAFVMIIPDKKRAALPNKFFVYLHDLFNFKSLWLEKIIKFLYVFNTLSCIGIGFFMLFSTMQTWGGTQWLGGYGLLFIILGPIVTRIIYEFAMITILAVKNLIDINNKLNPQPGSVADKSKKETPAPPVYRQPQPQKPVAPPAYGRPQQPAPPAYNQPQQPAAPNAYPRPQQQNEIYSQSPKKDTPPQYPYNRQ